MTQAEFGERVYLLRSKTGLTQARFKDLYESIHGYIAHLELGHRSAFIIPSSYNLGLLRYVWQR